MTARGFARIFLVIIVALLLLVAVYLGSHFIDLPTLIKTVGLIGIVFIIFAESGLLIGFFLPGDSLLFTAGILASQGYLDIRLLVPLCFAAAVIGDSFGYWFGHKVGPALFRRQDSFLFHRDHLKKAEDFYEEHGGKTIILARFMPVIRTFAPIVAGIGRMEYRKFLMFNVVGGFIWAVCIPLMGYFLGNAIPDIEKYLIPIILVIVLASVIPPLRQLAKDPKQRAKIATWLRG